MPFVFTFLLISTAIEDSFRRRMMRYSRFLLVGHLLMASICQGFLQDLATEKRYQAMVITSRQQQHVIEESPRTTALSMAGQQPQKPPRFVQKAHAKKSKPKATGSNPSRKSPSQKSPQRKSGASSSIRSDTDKSLEEIEQRLMKRWGTLEDPKGGQKARPDSAGSNPFQRKVLDPWEKEAGHQQQVPIVREFYDEDDEGFEIMELDEDDEEDWDDAEWENEDGTPVKNPRMSIGHLISPNPVGGQGRLESNAPVKENYFFNANKQVPVPKTNPKQERDTKKSKENTASNQEDGSIKKRPPRAAAASPLLDEEGNEILLTVDEAQYRFESTTTSDEAVEAMMDEDEAPIVAYQQATQPSWTNIGITSDILLENLNAMYCANPLDVQQKTIPHILTGSDVLVGMYTGSGKTLAFLTPLIQKLLWQDDGDPGLAVIIVAPGRELASQIVSVARQLVEDTPLKVQLAIGGTTFGRNLEQIRKRKPNILVGTPGRIAELVVGKPGERSGRLKINNLQSLVLDEFDALLEYKPHREPTRAILQALQRRHGAGLQSILCSATASDLMDSPKVTEYLRPGFATALADDDDVFVTGSKAKRPQVSKTVMHGVVHVPHKRFALETIRRVLHTEPIPQQILIFVESARKVEVVVEKLEQQGIIAAPLHGGSNSDKMDRAEVSKALREGYVGIVVATEMAARGLDAPLLTHVINMDLPTDASHYAHRAGRCGRGGRPGVVINITTGPRERKVPQRLADSLGIDMYTVEARKGKLLVVDPETQTLDES